MRKTKPADKRTRHIAQVVDMIRAGAKQGGYSAAELADTMLTAMTVQGPDFFTDYIRFTGSAALHAADCKADALPFMEDVKAQVEALEGLEE